MIASVGGCATVDALSAEGRAEFTVEIVEIVERLGVRSE
jgi:hypothetical protein